MTSINDNYVGFVIIVAKFVVDIRGHPHSAQAYGPVFRDKYKQNELNHN